MPIFRYTFKKILISPSTWVIFGLTLVVLGLAWSLPLTLATDLNGEKVIWTKDLVLTGLLPFWKNLSFLAFIGLMLLIFLGVKGTQIFRDEIDDGTLLILVSKPISRNRIWFEKWLSFQATVVSFMFFSILCGGAILAIPGIGGSVVYLTLLPYMGILFGIGLLFDLIFTSVVLLISLVLNSKATIAITIGFAALLNIFSQAFEPLAKIPHKYYELSHVAAVYHDAQKNLDNSHFTWLNDQVTKNIDYRDEVADLMNKVYANKIKDIDYPNFYDPTKEKIAVQEIIAEGVNSTFTEKEITLLTHIKNISELFRISNQQSYEELMSAKIPDNKRKVISYTAYNLVKNFNTTVTESEIKEFNTKITQKRIMRYLNIFYQLSYLWKGAWFESKTLYDTDSTYIDKEDPYLVAFNSKEDGGYQVALDSGHAKIINFPVLLAFYLILGTGLLGVSWYIFNRRDFT